MTAALTFTKATKEGLSARIALAGPTGSGKTWTALTLATELAQGGRIAVIDTERRSASKYADDFDFDTLALTSFAPRTLVEALAAAADAGFAVAIVDSLSHFWMGTDGMLQLVDSAAKRSGGGNSFAGWKEARPEEQAMIDALMAYPGHVIVTMRTKTEWVIEDNERGRKVPRKIGMKPEQREGIEYEFDIVGDMDQENTLVISKTRCPSLSGKVIRRPGRELGEEILGWLSSGKPAPTATDYRDQALTEDATFASLGELMAEVRRRQLEGAAVRYGNATISLGELIVQRGKALKNAPAEAAK